MERKKNRDAFRQRRTGFAGRGILTVLFVCVFSGFWMVGCGPVWEADFFLEQRGEADGFGADNDPDMRAESAAGAGNENGSGADPLQGETERFLYVHVCGAVNNPGLKKLPEGSRAFDALEMAEGFSEEADPDAVNLAAYLTDGQQLYFPALGEEGYREAVDAESEKVNLNTAGEKELCTLQGIGTSRAQAILKYRREKGGFDRIEELMQVPGIKENIFEQICDRITVK